VVKIGLAEPGHGVQSRAHTYMTQLLTSKSTGANFFHLKTFALKVGTLVENAIAELIQRMQMPKGTYKK
jgi:hypothetical protein